MSGVVSGTKWDSQDGNTGVIRQPDRSTRDGMLRNGSLLHRTGGADDLSAGVSDGYGVKWILRTNATEPLQPLLSDPIFVMDGSRQALHRLETGGDRANGPLHRTTCSRYLSVHSLRESSLMRFR